MKHSTTLKSGQTFEEDADFYYWYYKGQKSKGICKRCQGKGYIHKEGIFDEINKCVTCDGKGIQE